MGENQEIPYPNLQHFASPDSISKMMTGVKKYADLKEMVMLKGK
jgi:hypothetical protein